MASQTRDQHVTPQKQRNRSTRFATTVVSRNIYFDRFRDDYAVVEQ